MNNTSWAGFEPVLAALLLTLISASDRPATAVDARRTGGADHSARGERQRGEDDKQSRSHE